jgi:CheY-like chemotaxis protein
MPTVLVVDDTQVIRDTVARLLRTEGFNAICCANGREALDMVGLAHPDLMLLDIMMPEMDGLALLRALRNRPDGEKLPVIVMSAFSDEETTEQAAALGASDYLIKAKFTVKEMINNIRRHLPA